MTAGQVGSESGRRSRRKAITADNHERDDLFSDHVVSRRRQKADLAALTKPETRTQTEEQTLFLFFPSFLSSINVFLRNNSCASF